MTAEESWGNGTSNGMRVPPRRLVPHYHGNEVRSLFVIGAILIVVAQSTGADLPMSTTWAVMSSILLVIAAGITNPVVNWIHWVNSFFAMYGTLLFGTTAVDHYRAGISIFDPSFFYIEGLALLSLITLYFTTRTIRGMFLNIR